MSSFYEFICYGCGGPSDIPLRYLCTCEHCGNILIDEACLKCNSGAGNSFTYDPIPESFNEVQSISNPPPQSHFKIYLCQLCESNSHYGYECSQRVPLVYEPEPCFNQNFGDNAYPHDSPGVTPLIDHHCCYKFGDSLDDFFCNQCTCEFCGNGAHDGYNCHHINNESFFDEDISKEIYSNSLFDEEIISMKIDPHHFNVESDLIESLLNHDSLIISSSLKIDYLFDEFAGELILLKSIPSGTDETDCNPKEEIRLIMILLYDNSSPRPPKEFISKNSDAAIESFSSSPIPIEDKLLSNDSFSLPKNEPFHFDILSSPRPLAKPPDDDEIKPNSEILTVKVVGDISEHDVPMPRLLPTQPTLASNKEKSLHLLSYQGFKAFRLTLKIPMIIYGGNTPILEVLFLHLYPP
uniref:Pre-mRNA splicing Prp18-interacting factor n=1 Tax=Tanacetum cinerariifolium TaxID=118510 RepID=A0A6L2MZC3_TANCI|nr:hypothetical protein [Tanacetum cinerariifolium]